MNRAIEFVAYQLVWFAAVIGAGAGLWWAGLAAAVPLAAWQVASAARPSRTALLGLAGVLCGIGVDGGLATFDVLRHAAQPAGWSGAPPWILALWAVFAMSLHRSLDMLRGRPRVAAALGLVGGPAAYLAAARGWSAVEFVAPTPVALAWLAGAWGGALAMLASLARPPSTAAQRRLAQDAGA